GARLYEHRREDPPPLEQRAPHRPTRPGPASAPRRLHVADLEGARRHPRRPRHRLSSALPLRHVIAMAPTMLPASAAFIIGSQPKVQSTVTLSSAFLSTPSS